MSKFHIEDFILAGVVGSFLVFPQQFADNFLFFILGVFVLLNPIISISILIVMFFIRFIVMRKKSSEFKKTTSFICLILFVMFLCVLYLIDIVVYIALYNIINTILFIIFFAGYCYLNKNTKIAKYLTLCSFVISCLSLIVFMLFFIDIYWFITFRRIFFKLSSSWTWTVFFIGLALHKTNETHDNTYFEIPLLLATFFLLHGFLSVISYTFLFEIVFTDIISLFGILSLTVGVLRLVLLINMYISRTT